MRACTRRLPVGPGPDPDGDSRPVDVAIVGGGIVGLTQAHELLRRGLRVALFESGTSCAGQASHANGGQISSESGAPWMTPQIRHELPRWLFDRHRPVSLKPLRMGWATLPWLGMALRNTALTRYRANHRALLTLARYSLRIWEEIGLDLGSPLAPGRGVLYLYRTTREWDAAQKLLACEHDLAMEVEVLGPDECLDRMPILRQAEIAAAGGFWYPGDRFGDCGTACNRLLMDAIEKGARIHTGEAVLAVEPGKGSSELVTAHGRYPAEKVVIAAGVGSIQLARSAGIRLGICPVKGYTRTYRVPSLPSDGPALADLSRKVVLTPLASGLRVAGMAVFAGFDDRPDARYLSRIQETATDWLPGLRAATSDLDWACLRPMTPDGLPILGEAGPSGVILNVGHGPLGWTLAAGCARIVADEIAPDPKPKRSIDITPYRLDRGPGST